MAYIDIIDSTGNDYRYLLPEDGSVILIGTDATCSIALPEIPDMQPQHCCISRQQEGYVLSAMPGATVLAEGVPTEAVMLVPHAVYNVGSAMLMFNDTTPESLEGVLIPQSVQMQVEEPEPTPENAVQAEEVYEEPAAEEPVKKAKKKQSKKPGTASILSTAIYTIEDSALHVIIRRLYFIVILALSFLAGLTVRCWMNSGKYLIDELFK